MSDLREAFLGYSDNNAELKFDITNIGENQHLGVVSLPKSEAIGTIGTNGSNGTESFSYRVYPIPQAQKGNGFTADFKMVVAEKVIEGVVSKTNNTTFTFPISSLNTHYFVLITNNSVVDSNSRVSNGIRDALLHKVPNSSLKDGETFAMFYPKKVIKARRARLTSAAPAESLKFYNQSNVKQTEAEKRNVFSSEADWSFTDNNVNKAWNLPESFINAEWFPIQSNLDK